MPRVFLAIDPEQRLTILTMLVAHLQQLDVISLPPHADSIEVFLSSVIPPLVPLIESSPLGILIGLTGILLERNYLPSIISARVGLAFLTLFFSRAQIILAEGAEEGPAWREVFDKFFEMMTGRWATIFPAKGGWTDDVYVWQFLASVAVGASMDQQRELVYECRYTPCAVWGNGVGNRLWRMFWRVRGCRLRLPRVRLITRICF
jgi:DNA topoisomerase 2-associated protein PAT1